MSYQPGEPIGIETTEQLRQYLREELRLIARELSETDALELRNRNAAPVKPRDGMIVAADGVVWDPGAGAGIYGRVGGAWVKLS